MVRLYEKAYSCYEKAEMVSIMRKALIIINEGCDKVCDMCPIKHLCNDINSAYKYALLQSWGDSEQ